MKTSRLRHFYQSNPWKARLAIALFSLIILLTIIRLALSPVIIYSTNSWLKSQGIDSSIEDVRINILSGSVSLINAQGLQENKPLFHVGLVEIHWLWQPLSNKTIEVSSIKLDKLSINIKHYSDLMHIGGVSIPLGESSTVNEEKNDIGETAPLAWAANLGQVVFSNLNICYLHHSAAQQKSNNKSLSVDYCTTLDEMSWQGKIAYAADGTLGSSGDFALSGLTVTDNRLHKNLLVSKSSKLNKVSISGLNNISIKKLQMDDLSLLQREDKQHKDSIRFKQLTINDITLSDLNSLVIGKTSIDQPGFYVVKHDDTNWEYQQWLPATENEPVKIAAEPEKTNQGKTAFSLSLKDISITAADLCYLDEQVKLYYCTTFNSFDWRGETNFSTLPAAGGELNLQLTGDIRLSSLNIKNLSLSRDLLDIKQLDINKLAVDGINKLSLENFDINTLSALQRSENKEDSTASFEKLTINDLSYSPNNIAINTIKLTGLGQALSKNKNGEWEHDKWLPENTDKSTIKKQQDKQPAAKEQPTLVIALNKFEIETDKKLLFTDNSTTPAMKVGLNSLDFQIDELDTKKPDTSSQFGLQAKTIRHSTIDIAGSITPFSEKISFDAEGKIKGFDLRAITPATKKAIGHKIQSGQMDAELTLKAVDGVLDSNIALSLYHFKIKPESKKDAEALDKKFGMPLNQTLVLLRDRDDSIHLDIPVTGDVNNPNFDPMDAIITATSKAATVTLITFYTPYGLIYAGGNIAFNLATALNFDPIIFSAGSAELQDDNKQALDELSKLMKEKPQIHLTLCGITNATDALTLFPELKKQKTEKPDLGLTAEQGSKLESIARQRQINSKNYLIAEHEIGHERLILCAPEHKSEKEAIAGVTITI